MKISGVFCQAPVHILQKPNSIIALLFIQNIFKLLKEKMSFIFNNFAPSTEAVAPQRCGYPQRPKVKVDNTLRDLQNSSYPTKAKFNNCFIIHSKYFPVLKGVSPVRSLFFPSPKITQPCPQVFSVNGPIICSRLHF